DNIGPVNWHRRENVPSCLLHHIKAIKLFVWERKGVEFQMVVQLVEYILKKAKVLECLTLDTRATKKEERIMVLRMLSFLQQVFSGVSDSKPPHHDGL
ncbi:hypothetical protein Goshw_016344, partial [Gossypium schwendimanii]|nr:hypothetical protein [Gossypium schwendimanii]